MCSNQRGLTLIEIMLVTFIIGMLTAIGAAWHLRARDRSQLVVCAHNRIAIETAEDRYVLGEGNHSLTLQDLTACGYLKEFEGCPAGGDYAWIEATEGSSLYHSTLACSTHGIEGAE